MRGWYTIHTHQEETDCTLCGFPMFEGDEAYEAENGEVYCCRNCAKKDQEIMQEKDRKREAWKKAGAHTPLSDCME